MGSLQVYTSYTPLNKELFPIAWENDKSIGIDVLSYNGHTQKENKHRIFFPKYLVKKMQYRGDETPWVPTNMYNEKILSITLDDPDMSVVQDKGFKTSIDMLKQERDQAEWESGREDRERREREYVPDNIKKLNTVSEIDSALNNVEVRRKNNKDYYEYSDASNAYYDYTRTEEELNTEKAFLLKRKGQIGENCTANKRVAERLINSLIKQTY